MCVTNSTIKASISSNYLVIHCKPRWTSCITPRVIFFKYVGEYKGGKRDGQGTLTWATGYIYIGEWKGDKTYGQGTYTYASGEKYVGEFKNGKRNGQGTFTTATGEVYQGEWGNGEFIGK